MKCCSSGFWIRGKFGSTGGRGGGEKHGPLLVVAVDMIVIVILILNNQEDGPQLAFRGLLVWYLDLSLFGVGRELPEADQRKAEDFGCSFIPQYK